MNSPLVGSQMATNMKIKHQHQFRKWKRTVPIPDEWLKGEPHLQELLTDPIVHLVMRRDNLGPDDVWMAIDQARDALHGPAAHARDVA